MRNETAPIPLPPKTREMLRNLVAERATLQALLEQADKSIGNILNAAREMLEVPDGWEITKTEVGFTAPMVPAPPSE